MARSLYDHPLHMYPPPRLIEPSPFPPPQKVTLPLPATCLPPFSVVDKQPLRRVVIICHLLNFLTTFRDYLPTGSFLLSKPFSFSQNFESCVRPFKIGSFLCKKSSLHILRKRRPRPSVFERFLTKPSR